MSNEKDFFDKQIISLRALTSIYQYLEGNASFLDASSLLRAEFVLIVSALDNYFHSIVRRKIRENFFNAQFLPSSFDLPITSCLTIHNETDANVQQQILDATLRKQLEKDSFQAPKGVEYALGLINIKSVWSKVAPSMGETADHVKNQLAIIVKRRNQIAHETDIDHSTDLQRPIDEQTVNECREFVQNLIAAVDALII